MDTRRYWFPVKPARNGWGWGLPVVWQGWVVFLGYFVMLIAGIVVLAPFGVLAIIGYSLALGALLLAIFFWKGEPQSMRDERSP
ncbi:MAG: hypothetical protein WCC39_00260 [Telluria sp.]